MSQDLQYEIRDIQDPEGGLALELHAEGQRIAGARASIDVLASMEQQLGMKRDDVRTTLLSALVDYLKHQLAKVDVTPPRMDPPDTLRYVSRFTYRDFDNISTGVVWYDVRSGETGPDAVLAVVRNKMRFEVHRALTDQSSNARGIVNLLK